MRSKHGPALVFSGVFVLCSHASAAAVETQFKPMMHVFGEAIGEVQIVSAALKQDVEFAKLAETKLAPASYAVKFSASGEGIEFPPCNVRGAISVDGKPVSPQPSNAGPFIYKFKGANTDHEVSFEVRVSDYEKRIACGFAPRVGTISESREDLQVLQFESPHAKACKGSLCTPGLAAVFVPKGHDTAKPGSLLIGLHPWNGQSWTYAAYRELLLQAQERDVVVLLPSGLGNSLYTAPAEDEVLRALAALEAVVAVDKARVSIFGASMGGGGATTVGLHHPDRFATITSFFGDAKFEVAGYTKTLLPTEADAHRVNPLDVIENARQVPVWLIHGDADKTSPVVQSELLYAAMSERKYKVRFDKEAGRGHEGSLVTKHLRKIVDLAAIAKAPALPSRVSYKSVRKEDEGAYGVSLVRLAEGDALFDLEYVGGKLRLHAASNVKELVLRRGALGIAAGADRLPEVLADGALKPMPIRFQDP
jgi:Prolyl oligopeptidase family